MAWVAFFALLAFNPLLWNQWLAHVLREGLYVGLSLAVFGLLTLVSFPELRTNPHSVVRNAILGVGLGIVGAAYWLTREEGIWLLPASLVLIAMGLIRIAIISGTRRSDIAAFSRKSEDLRALAITLAIGAVVFAGGIGLVAGMNWAHYGVFETNEFKSASFLRAYGAVTRIRHDKWQRFVDFPTDARQRAYAVSPAARELAPSLDGEIGRSWQQGGCSYYPDIQPCTEILGGWFIWALRDSAAAAGHHSSAREASRFYNRLAREINAACDNGRIPCLSPRATLMPPFRWEFLGETITSAEAFSTMMFTMGKGEVGSYPSFGTPPEIAIFADLTGGVAPPPWDGRVLMHVEGWAAALSSSPILDVLPHTQQVIQKSITMSPAPDVTAVLPNLRSVRFTLQSNCPINDCDLAVKSNEEHVSVPFRVLVHGAVVNDPSLIVYLDHVSVEDNPTKHSDQLRTMKMRIAHFMALAYAKSCRTLAIVAFLSLVVSFLRVRRSSSSLPLLAIGLGSFVAVGTRIALLSYIDATSFRMRFVNYPLPASPFVIIFAVVGIYSWYVTVRSAHRRHPGRSSLPPGAGSSDQAALRVAGVQPDDSMRERV